MLTTPLRLLAALALAATTTLATTSAASAQSETGAVGAGSLGSNGAAVATGSLGSSGSTAPTPAPVRAYADYVALGDSYAALGDQTQPVSATDRCGNSRTNYPHLLDAHPRVGTLQDVSCGGATVPDVTSGQIDALSPDTDLVTLSIGGNDVGFGEMVGCLTRQGPFAPLPPTTSCASVLDARVSSGIASVYGDGGAVDAVYDAIAARAPGAKVVTTRYLPLLPDEGSCAFTDALVPADVAWARDVTARINTAVDAAATRNGHVSVLPTDTIDRSACAPADQRWTDFLGGAPTNAAPMHPTTLGQAAVAVAIAAAV